MVLHVLGKGCEALIEEGADVSRNIVLVEGPTKASKPGVDLGTTDGEWIVPQPHIRETALWCVKDRATGPFHEVRIKPVP